MRTNMRRERGTKRKRRMRRIVRERMTRMRVRAMRELLLEDVQKAQGMVTPILSSFPLYGQSTTSSQQ